MKKRMLSVVLTLMMLISSMPLVSATTSLDGSGTKSDPYKINDFIDLQMFLDSNLVKEETTYYSIEGDIDGNNSTIEGNVKAKNIVIEGNNHNISMLSINHSLFSTLTDSEIRNLNFSKVSVGTLQESSDEPIGVIAGQLVGFTSYITGCTFTQSCVVLSEQDISISSKTAGIVVGENSGNITNCRIISSQDMVSDFTYGTEGVEYTLGGIAGENLEGGVISNCISYAINNTDNETITSTFGTITGYNEGYLYNCYSPASADIVAKNSGGTITSCYYKSNNRLYQYGNDTAITENIYVTAAKLSDNASTYNDTCLEFDPPITTENYASLWTVNNGELDLAIDSKEGVVMVYIDSELYAETDEVEQVVVTAENTTGFNVIEVDANGNPTCVSVLVGAYNKTNTEYTRNNLIFTFKLKNNYTMVNNLKQKYTHTSTAKLVDIFDSSNHTYSEVYYAGENKEKTSTFTLELFPYISRVSFKDSNTHITNYMFKGEGTKSNPFLISSEYELRCLSYHIEKGNIYTYGANEDKSFNKAYYKLTNDIKMSDVPFTPIGINSDGGTTFFEGKFDGGSYTISNLVINSTNNYLGLFGSVKGKKDSTGIYTDYAEIKNLNVFNATIKETDINSPSDIKGIVVGRAEDAIISGCVSSGTVQGGTQIAGVVGYSYYSKILSCGSTAKVQGYSSKTWIGGVVANAAHSQVENCYFSGEVRAEYVVENRFLKTGGITAYNNGSTFDNNSYKENCVFIDGVKDNSANTMSAGINSVSDSTIKSQSFTDDLAKYADQNHHYAYWKLDTNINNGYPYICKSTEIAHNIYCIKSIGGTITTDKTQAMAGETINVTVDITGENVLKSIRISDLENNTIKTITEPNQKPITFEMPDCSVNIYAVFDTGVFNGYGTENEPFMIMSYEDLVFLSNVIYNEEKYTLYDNGNPKELYYRDAYYAVCNDINCAGKALAPIGDVYNLQAQFSGTFDGRGYSILNLKLDNSKENAGMFAKVKGATIKDLRLRNIVSKFAKDDDTSVKKGAVLCGSVDGATITNVSIYDSEVAASDYSSVLFTALTGTLNINNLLIDGITFEKGAVTSLLGEATKVNANVNNTVVMNIPTFTDGVVKNLQNNTFSGNNNYVGKGVIYDSTKEPLDLVTKTTSELLDDVFISELSFFSENNLTEYSAGLWGKNSDSELGISINRKPRAISKVTFDQALFAENMFGFISQENLPVCGTDGSKIQFKYKYIYDLSNLNIQTKEGDLVTYEADVVDDGNGFCTISFVMPEGYVYITNNGKVPNQSTLYGCGTAELPYLIYSYGDLMCIDNVLEGNIKQKKIHNSDKDFYTANFKVMNDIDLTDLEWDGIGDNTKGFAGVFDGGHYSISGLKNSPLFTCLDSPETVVQNVVLNDPYFVPNNYEELGAITVYNYGTITKCRIYGGNFDAARANVGGFAFTNKGTGHITYCALYDTVVLNGDRVGLLAVYNEGDCYGCYLYRQQGCNSIDTYLFVIYGGCDSCSYNSGSAMLLGIFSDGSIAYSINSKRGIEVWYQNIDNGLPKDPYPVLFSNGQNTVYYNEDENKYSNYDIKLEMDEDGKYIIKNYDDLCLMRDRINGNYKESYLSASYVLTNDIQFPTEENWINSIGTHERPFKGTFDGKGYTIKGMNILNKADEEIGNYVGLFGYTDGATIKNLNMADVTIDSVVTKSVLAYCGTICAYADNASKIYNCTVEGDLTAYEYRGAGGICGYLSYTGSVYNCMTFGKITFNSTSENSKLSTTKLFIGGIVGEGEYASVTNCGNLMDIIIKNDADIKSESNGTIWVYAGGIAAYSWEVSNCYNYGSSSVYSDLQFKYEPISYVNSNCYYLGNTSAEQFASGEITYKLNNGVTDGTQVWYQNMDNEDSVDKYPILSSGGTVYKVATYDCLGNKYGEDYSNHNVPIMGLHIYDNVCDYECNVCGEKRTFNGHKFSDNGFCTICDAYEPAVETINKYDSDGEVTMDIVYEIYNAGQLYWFAENVVNGNSDINGKLMNDICVNEGDVMINTIRHFGSAAYRKWIVVGSNENSVPVFEGVFDGQGYTISGLCFENSNVSYVGLFASNAGTIKKVGLYNSYFKGKDYVGSICGNNTSGGIVEDCYIRNVATEGNECIGGLVGANLSNASVKNSYAYSDYLGDSTYCDNTDTSIAGVNQGTIQNCYYLYTQENDSYEGTTFKTKEQFASGEVTWLLNGKKAPRTAVWKQNIGEDDGENADDIPKYEGELVTYFSPDKWDKIDEAYYYGIDLDGKMQVEADGNRFNLDTEEYTNIELLGVQKKEVPNENAMRFIAVADSELLKKAENYGFVYLATNKYTAKQLKEKAGSILTLDSNISKTVVNCKGTDNKLAGDYGIYSAPTNYKYVTSAIEGINDSNKDIVILARFFITINGETYYSYYTDNTLTTYDGCACSYNGLTNSSASSN